MKPGFVALGFMAGAAFLAALPAWSSAYAASHREAPLIAFEPAADTTDTYALLRYDEENLDRSPANRQVTLIVNVNPGQEPDDEPNYFNFDDTVYLFHTYNDADGVEDIVYEIRFETRPAMGAITDPLPYIGNPDIQVVELTGITAPDGPGSEGLTRRQMYTVTELRDGVSTDLFQGQLVVVVPSNVGPVTMPDHEDLAWQGIYEPAWREFLHRSGFGDPDYGELPSLSPD